MLISPVQPLKAYAGMVVTLLGIVIFVKPLQSKKVAAGIVVTLFPIFTVASFEQSPNIGLSDDPALVHAVAFQLTVVSSLQPEKAASPMLVTLSGIVTLVRPVQ